MVGIAITGKALSHVTLPSIKSQMLSVFDKVVAAIALQQSMAEPPPIAMIV